MISNISEVLVTGSADRLGAKILDYFAESGHKVLGHTSNSTKAEAAAHEFIACDFNNLSEINHLASRAKNAEILVNNAAAFIKDDIDNMTPETLMQNFCVSAFAPMLLAAKMPRLKQVINILDARIACNQDDYFLSYKLSKQVLANYTQSACHKMANKGIRINGIALGFIMPPEGQGGVYQNLLDKTPLKKQTTIKELCDCINLIISSESMTGNIIYLDSGLSCT